MLGTSDVLAETTRVQPRMVDWRREIHMYPELGLEEVRTSGLIRSVLSDLGLEVRAGEPHTGTPTGVVGILRGGRAGSGSPTVGLRADIDALPLQEKTGLPYASRVPDRMHACGHDGHAAILLGTATVLAGHRDSLRGNVKFIFQPAEEDPGGAKPMIEAGVLKDPDVDIVLALHLDTTLPTGTIGVRPGGEAATANCDRATIRILGRGGHGAWPHHCVDPVVVAAQVVLALQTVISRERHPLDPLVFTVGSIRGGEANNVIPDEVVLKATIRTAKDETQKRVATEQLPRLIGGITAAAGAAYELDYVYEYPSLRNDPEVTRYVVKAGELLLGADRVKLLEEMSMGGEDFAFFARERPGCMFRLGAKNEAKGCVYPGHSSRFNFDEDAMPLGAAVFVHAVLDYLGAGARTR